jgi:hypothetical protein
LPLSPTLFNIYLDELITKWQKQDITGIKLSKTHQLSTLLFADDQIIIADTEDNVQKAAHKLNQIITEYGLTVSVQKKGLDIDNKLQKYLKITGILNNVFRPRKSLKKTRIKLYNTLAVPVLLYGSETWNIKARDARRITAAKMKYMRRTAGYTWTDYKTNTQITKELKITPILDKLLEHKRNWIQHINRMPRNRLPRVMKHYFPTGGRNYGGLLKRLLDT